MKLIDKILTDDWKMLHLSWYDSKMHYLPDPLLSRRPDMLRRAFPMWRALLVAKRRGSA